jgi:hypothetical protein
MKTIKKTRKSIHKITESQNQAKHNQKIQLKPNQGETQRTKNHLKKHRDTADIFEIASKTQPSNSSQFSKHLLDDNKAEMPARDAG